MNQSLFKYVAPVKNKWNGFNSRQKRNIAVSLVCGIACLSAIGWIINRPNYVTVMSGLDDTSLGQVQQELDTLKIPNQINGSSVLVPKSSADEARIQLSMAGLPKTGEIDYSSIKSSYGMTQDQFNIQVLNVLQQQLAQTIDNMNGVVASQVNIVMPQQSDMFVNNNQSAKASVFLQVGTGAQVSPTEVAGIQSLVAHAVSGLSASNVSVVDQNGNTLSAQSNASDTGAVLTDSEISTRQQIESQLQQQLQSGLNQIVGPGNAVVTVNADVTFDQIQSQTHTVSPAQGQSTGLPSNQQVTKSSTTGGGTVGGVVGQSSTNPGSPTYPGTTGSGTGSTSTNSETTTNYDNNYTNTQTTTDPIQIKGYSVGVMVNGSDKGITPAVMSQLKSYVQNTVGTQSGLQNSVTVSSVPFLANTVQLVPPAKNYTSMALAAIAGLLLIGGGIWFVIARRRKKTQEPTAPVQFIDDRPLEVNEGDYMKTKVSKLASDNPEQFASLLRTWLNDD